MPLALCLPHKLPTQLASNSYHELTPETAAKAFGRFLNVALRRRHHPHHELLVKFVPVKESFKTSEPIPVKLQIKNVGKLRIYMLLVLVAVGMVGCQNPPSTSSASPADAEVNHQGMPVKEESKGQDSVPWKQDWKVKLQELYRDCYDKAYRGEPFALQWFFCLESFVRYKDGVDPVKGNVIDRSSLSQSEIVQKVFRTFRERLVLQSQSPDAITRAAALERLRQLDGLLDADPSSLDANAQLYAIDLWKLLHKVGDQVFFNALKAMAESTRRAVIQHLDNEAKRREEDYSKKYPQTYGLVPRQ